MNAATRSAPAGTAAPAASALRVGVIGVGRIGRMHAELLARQVEGASVTAVQDVHVGSALQVGAELDVPVAATAEEVMAAAATGTSSAAPTCCALPPWTSWTAVTLAPSTWRASSSACIRPMRPTPITPTRTGGAAVAVVVSISPP